jgi:hypothetical protein
VGQLLWSRSYNFIFLFFILQCKYFKYFKSSLHNMTNIAWIIVIMNLNIYIYIYIYIYISISVYECRMSITLLEYVNILLKLTCAAKTNKTGSRLTSNHIWSSVSTIHLKNKKRLFEGSSNLCLWLYCCTDRVHRLIYRLGQGPSNMVNTLLFLSSKKQYY